MPLTRCMIALIPDIESGRRSMAWENLDVLLALHGTPKETPRRRGAG